MRDRILEKITCEIILKRLLKNVGKRKKETQSMKEYLRDREQVREIQGKKGKGIKQYKLVVE